jgi:hypothetical protein
MKSSRRRARASFIVALATICNLLPTFSPTASAISISITAPLPARETTTIEVSTTRPFDPAGGTVIVDEGTPSEEVIVYASIDEEAKELEGLVREDPVFHEAGSEAEVQPEASQNDPGESQASPSPSPNPSQAPAETNSGSSTAQSEPSPDPSAAPSEATPTGLLNPLDPVSCVPGIGLPLNPTTVINKAVCVANEAIQEVQPLPSPCDVDPGDCNPVPQPCDGTIWGDALCLVENPPSINCPDQTIYECFGVPEVNLDPEDLILDPLINGTFDSSACDVDISSPTKVHDESLGYDFVFGDGSADCPGYDRVVTEACIQIKTPDGWKRKNCNAGTGPGGGYGYASVFAPCVGGTHLYRTKFSWQAEMIAGTIGSGDSPDSGTRKIPFAGVKIYCVP